MRKDDFFDAFDRFWADEQTPQRLSLREPRQARTAGGARKQGARGEARAQRSVSVRLDPPVSRAAACV